MLGKSIRIERITRRDTKRTVIVPMDHGVSVGPVPGLIDMPAMVDLVARGGADAVLGHVGLPRLGHRGYGPDIGLILHLMLLGHLPRRDGKGRYVPTPPSEEAGELSTELDEAILKALAEDPARRFADAEEMMHQLYLLYAHRPMPVSAGPPSWYEDRRFWLYVAIAMGGLALVLALATGMIPLPFL